MFQASGIIAGDEALSAGLLSSGFAVMVGPHAPHCTAEDSCGDQYPVTQSTWGGFGLPDMTTAEDDALDRCYSESGGDPSCYLATCSHY
jgi:hypothetical protein